MPGSNLLRHVYVLPVHKKFHNERVIFNPLNYVFNTEDTSQYSLQRTHISTEDTSQYRGHISVLSTENTSQYRGHISVHRTHLST